MEQKLHTYPLYNGMKLKEMIITRFNAILKPQPQIT